MRKLGSSFSVQMLERFPADVNVEEMTQEEFRTALRPLPRKNYMESSFHSVVGHEGTATALTKLLGFDVHCNRESITLDGREPYYFAQPTGKRITYGEEIDFPELRFFKATVRYQPKPKVTGWAESNNWEE